MNLDIIYNIGIIWQHYDWLNVCRKVKVIGAAGTVARSTTRIRSRTSQRTTRTSGRRNGATRRRRREIVTNVRLLTARTWMTLRPSFRAVKVKVRQSITSLFKPSSFFLFLLHATMSICLRCCYALLRCITGIFRETRLVKLYLLVHDWLTLSAYCDDVWRARHEMKRCS